MKEKDFEIRFSLKPNMRKDSDRVAYEALKEIKEYYPEIHQNQLVKMCIVKAHKYWFLPELRNKIEEKK